MNKNEGTQEQRLQRLILSVFRSHAPDVKDSIIEAIEKRSGITLESLTVQNSEKFLEAMTLELSTKIDEWKARFVTKVVQNIIEKRLKG